MHQSTPHLVLVGDAGRVDQVRCEVQLLPDGRGFVGGVCAEQLPWALNYLRTKCWIERRQVPSKVVAVAELESDLGWSEVEVDSTCLPLAQVTRRHTVAAAEREQVRAAIGEMRARRTRRRRPHT